jgi:hypothetical protein
MLRARVHRIFEIARSVKGGYLRACVVLVAAPGVALASTSASPAANPIPNPGFEALCGSGPGGPCGWPPDFLPYVVRDTTIAHTGSASYRFIASSQTGSLYSGSDCVTGISSGSSLDLSYWYRTTDVQADLTNFFAEFHANVSCTDFISSSFVYASPLDSSGNWHQQTGSAIVPSGTQGVRFFLNVNCTAFPCTGGAPNGGVQVNFDDLGPPVPTAAIVTSIAARRTPSGVRLRWATAQEADLLGYNLFRAQHGKLVKLNRTLIPGVFGGTARGHAYSWLDRSGEWQRGALQYRLQAVSLGGNRSWVGVTRVTG